MGEASGTLPGLGWQSLALSFASLGVVCVVAYVALKLLAGRAVTKGLGSAVRVIARCPLEPRRSIYVVEAAGRCFLIGAGEGPMALLAELDPEKLPAPAPPAPRLAEVVARLLHRPGAGPR